MKTLMLVRHARAAPGTPTVPDHERPLDDRGRSDATAMGRRLAARPLQPGWLASSSALRAAMTARLIATELGCDPAAVVIDRRLYASSVQDLLAMVQALDDAHHCALLVGHNPEFSELAQRLCGHTAAMPPGAVATLHLDIGHWAEAGRALAVEATLDVPDQPGGTRDHLRPSF